MSAFTGTLRLFRLALRRDRITVPVTMLFAILMVGASAPALVNTYKTQEAILSYITSSVPSVVGRVFQGAVQGPTIGSILMAEVFLTGIIIVGIMSIFIISRHTRHNEETGAAELIGSGIVGKSAPLSAALLVAVVANIATGLLIFGILASVPEFDKTGSAFMALSIASFGLLMACISAITVQLSDYRRGANLMAIGVLGAFFVIRSFGDALGDISADGLSVTSNWITWISPMGWSFQVLPFAQNRIFPIAMMLGLALLTAGTSYLLMSKRDSGSSIFSSKPGPDRASKNLISTFGLTHRLQKSNFKAWATGFVVAGVLVAVIIDDFRKTFEENEIFAEWITASGGDSFIGSVLATMFPLLAAMLSGYVVSALSKMQDEESSGRIEYLLGTALGRVKWLLSHVGYTTMGIVVALGAMGAAGGIGYSLTAKNADLSGFDIFLSAISSLPAMLLFMSVIVLVYTAMGRFVKPFAWTFYAYCALIGSVAGIFNWPKWSSYFSPFDHSSLYPTNNFDWLPVITMSLLAALIMISSTLIFKRRDIFLK